VKKPFTSDSLRQTKKIFRSPFSVHTPDFVVEEEILWMRVLSGPGKMSRDSLYRTRSNGTLSAARCKTAFKGWAKQVFNATFPNKGRQGHVQGTHIHPCQQ
jgi:hypothetical protein